MDETLPRPIRVKALLIIPNDDFTAHAVAEHPPTAENPEGYHRFVGGSVELGESHADAARRECREELNAEVRDVELADVFESIYTFNGRLDHEIDFMYVGRPDPMPASLVEPDGEEYPLVWRPVDDSDQSLPLYPVDAANLIRRLAASARG